MGKIAEADSPAPWYVVIDRFDPIMEPMEPIVIGPFGSQNEAKAHANESVDVEDWVTVESNNKGYIVDEVSWTQDPPKPSYGINSPNLDYYCNDCGEHYTKVKLEIEASGRLMCTNCLLFEQMWDKCTDCFGSSRTDIREKARLAGLVL